MSSDEGTDDDGTKIKITVKTHTRNESFDVNVKAKVRDIKPDIASRFEVETGQLCLIYAGRMMNDAKTLEDQNVKDGFVVHLVIRSANPRPAQQEPPRESRISPDQEANLRTLTSSILNNPDYIRAVIAADPRLQAYMQQNPDIAHALSNPALLREYFQIVSNPHMMQEFMRSQDLSMRHLENTPGGYAALSTIYSNLSELEDDVLPPPIPQPANDTTTGNANPVDQTHLNSNPLPNPWLHEPNGPTVPEPSPESAFLDHLLNNPQLVQVVREMTSDPVFMRTILEDNQALTDHALRGYLQAHMPEVLEQIDSNSMLPPDEEMREYLDGMHVNMAEQEQLYGSQLEQLNAMGFQNRESNIRALAVTLGDLNLAIDILTRNPSF